MIKVMLAKIAPIMNRQTIQSIIVNVIYILLLFQISTAVHGNEELSDEADTMAMWRA